MVAVVRASVVRKLVCYLHHHHLVSSSFLSFSDLRVRLCFLIFVVKFAPVQESSRKGTLWRRGEDEVKAAATQDDDD